MLQPVVVGDQTLAAYETSSGPEAIAELRELAKPLQGLRVLHVNATSYGGGVAEILRSEIPLLRDLSIQADWKLVGGDQAFFTVTKNMHNGLQGGPREITEEEMETFRAYSKRNAKLLRTDYDIIVIHDPQPMALLEYHGGNDAKWIWRCHIDTSAPNPQVWSFVRPYLDGYDAAIFTMGKFVPDDQPLDRIEIIPPAIDPESPKNLSLETTLARGVLQWIGIDLDKPLITQVSRFDPWKDPIGVIETFKLLKGELPDLQLALVGSMASDDPEGWDIYKTIQEEAEKDANIHTFTNLTGVGNIEVNAFQRLSDVIIQKSIREGFGLVISEALWKHTPVVAGRAGGIPLQLQDRVGGFLIDSTEECAERTLWLLRNKAGAAEIVEPGFQLVRDRYLLTRLIADELRLYRSLVGEQPKAQVAT